MNSNDNLVKNTILLSAGAICAKGIQFLMIPFISRWLSTEAYGTFDVLCTYVTLLIPLLSLATGEAVFRFSAPCVRQEERTPFITNGFVLTSCNLLICSVILLSLSAMNILSRQLAAPFIFLLVSQLYNHYFQAYLRAIKRLTVYTMCNIVTMVFIAVLSIVFVRIFQWGLEGLIVAYASSYFLGNLIIFFYTHFWEFFVLSTVSSDVLKKIVKYSFPLIPNDISWWVLNVSDRQIILIALGAAANGIYAIANKIPALCSTIFSMFGVSWQQSIVERIKSGDWKEYTNNVFSQMIITLLTICMGILSATSFLYLFVFDPKYGEGIVYVPILLTAIIFSSIMQFLGGIQIALQKTYENGITTVIGAVINLLIDITLIRFIGLYAAALSTLVANFSTVFLRQRRLKGIITFRINKKAVLSILLYGYFLISFYLVDGNILTMCGNITLAGIAFCFLNRQILMRMLRSHCKMKPQ